MGIGSGIDSWRSQKLDLQKDRGWLYLSCPQWIAGKGKSAYCSKDEGRFLSGM